MVAEQIKRNIAFKLRIGDILSGQPILDEARFRFLELGDKNIVRVNLVANIVDKYSSEGERNYATLTIDDASGQIRLKMFGDDVKKFAHINPGNSVMVIGLLRYFNDEIYVAPEIIVVKDPKYLLIRKLELDGQVIRKSVPNKEKVLAVRDEIIELIKESDEEGGIDTEKIILTLKSSPEIINQEIKKMLEDGLAYEPRPGKVRYLG